MSERYSSGSFADDRIDNGLDDDGENEETGGNEELGMNELFFEQLQQFEKMEFVDIGNLALWKLSSYKSGCGLKQLREDSADSYWQSDGTQPHFVSIQFTKRVQIHQISLFTNFFLDESYTPSKIIIMAGNGPTNLKEVTSIEFEKPTGWKNITFENCSKDGTLKAFYIKVVVSANHQNGKDTHLRALKIFSKRNKTDEHSESSDPITDDVELPELARIPFSSIKFTSQSSIR